MFPAELFELDGDLDAIAASAQKWADFGQLCSDSKVKIEDLETPEFKGREADLYHQNFQDKLAGNLGQTGDAYTKVGVALANLVMAVKQIEDGEMNAVRIRALNLWPEIKASRDAAAAADPIYTVTNSVPALGIYSPPRASALEDQWNALVAEADAVQAKADEAARTCAATIRQAAGARFDPNPTGLGGAWLNSRGWIDDNSDNLAALGGSLARLSGLALGLSFVPGLGVVTIPIALATGAGSAGADAAIEIAEHNNLFTPMAVFDLALIAVPGARPAKTLSAAKRLGADFEFKRPAFPRKYFSNLAPEDSVLEFNRIPNSQLARINGQFNYVVRPNGELVVGRQFNGHIDLAQGRQVVAAGRVRVVGGKVRWFDNESGHYKPSGYSMPAMARKAFEAEGLVVPEAIFKKLR